MIHWIHTMVWGPGMLVLFLAVGILYTIRLRGFVFWGCGRRDVAVPVGVYGPGGYHRYRKHSRSGHSPFIRRAWSHILDVGVRLSGHGHGLWRNGAGDPLPEKGQERRLGGRTHALYGKGPGLPVGRASLRRTLRGGLLWYGQHGPGQCHFRDP